MTMPNDVAANARDKTTFGQQFGEGVKPEEREAWRTAGAVREAEQARATAVNEIMQTVDHHTDLSSDEYSDLAAAVAGILARRL